MTEEEFKAMGVIVCPHCNQMLDAADFNGLSDHIWKVHPEIGQRLQLDLFFDKLCDAGVIQRVK